jgi:aryl-alcohol dehydrogenase-like predicted oxidoreductase
MKKRKLGKGDAEITEIGLGTWAIGGPWDFGWGPQSDQESLEAIDKALESGINWIDTAPAYGLGHSEEIVGQAIKSRRDTVFLATKCGLVWDASRKVSNNNKPENIRKEVEDSLRRLGTDYIDLYQIHWPDPRTRVEHSWETMMKLKDEQKIRFAGVSNFNVRLLEKCKSIGHVDSLQPPYSLLDRRVEDEILPWCLENKTGVVAYSPLQNGLLTGKFSMDRLASDDWRHKSPFFQEPELSKNLEFTQALKPLAEKYGKSLIHLAIAWVLMHPAVTSAIVGARRASQVEDMIGGEDWTIDPEDMEKIEELREKILQGKSD